MIWHGGRPVLLVESFGKKLSACEGVSLDECQTAVTALGELAVIWQPWLRGRLRVETWEQHAGPPDTRCSLAESVWIRLRIPCPDAIP
jgi:hypothetical protein